MIATNLSILFLATSKNTDTNNETGTAYFSDATCVQTLICFLWIFFVFCLTDLCVFVCFVCVILVFHF